MKSLIAVISSVLVLAGALPAFAQESAFVREVQLEQARAKDFRHHEAVAAEIERERESHVDQYKEKVERQQKADEVDRKAYIEARNRREKRISDEEIDEILQQEMERQAAKYEKERQAFIRLRDQIEEAHQNAPLNENEEYGL